MKRPTIFGRALPIVASLSIALQSATAETYTVNTSSDNVVANACANHQANCSLRGAILAANANAGGTIVFNIVEFCPGSGCVINLLSPLPDISVPMSISGPTAFVIQRSSSAATNFRIFNVTTAGTVNFTSLTIAKGRLIGANGAGIQNLNGGTVNVTSCMVRDNVISGFGENGSGAGIFNSSSGTVNVSNSTLMGNNNFIGNGGGIFSNGTLNVTNSTFTTNRAQSGAGIAAGGTITVTGCTFSGNTAIGAGGEQNGDSGLAGRGGALFNAANANVSNSTFAGNSAAGGDGFNASGGDGRGGAVFHSGSNLNLTNSTIFANTASGGSGTTTGSRLGGGIETTNTTVTIKSSIIALNSATVGPDVRGSFTSGGFNFIGTKDGSTGFTAVTDKTGDPQLDPNGLQNNGGPTKTIALLPGSLAIDQGTSAGLTGNLTTDQRGTGFLRTSDDAAIANASGGDGTDIGAFEVQNASPTPTPTPTATPTATPAATPTATPVTTLANISTRLRVETGDNVLIGGFIITGTQPKKVIIRAIGTSLPLADKLANPTLELHGPNGLIEANDNWVDSPNKQAIIDSTIPPSSDLEAAIVQTLPANSTGYTAIVRGVNNGTGIGVVEAYDLDTTVDSRLANISTRGFVQTGDNVLIAGTIVVGQTPQRVLIRAIGPSLPIAGVMANPTLELRDASGTLLQANDNWVDSANKQAIIDTTIPPSNDLEAAIVATLSANGASYTAIVRGGNDSIGIAVVEVYALP